MEEISIITTNMDQPIPIRNIDDALSAIDTHFKIASETNDPEPLLEVAESIISLGRLTGIALAKIIWKLDWYWEDFRAANPDINDDFPNVAMERLGLSKEHITRSIRIWEMHDSGVIPEHVQKDILQTNIKSQIMIAKCFENEKIKTVDDWERLAYAPNANSVAKIKRELEGKPPRKGTLIIRVTRDGDLVAHKDDETRNVGHLEVESKHEIVKQAIRRIIGGAELLEE